MSSSDTYLESLPGRTGNPALIPAAVEIACRLPTMDSPNSNQTGKSKWVPIEESPTETDDARMERHFGFLQIGRICPDPIEYYLTLTAESVASLAATQPHETPPTYKQEPSRAAIEKIAGALQAVKDERTAIVREMNNATLEKLALTLGIVDPWEYISGKHQNVSGFDPRIPPVLEELHERIKFKQRRRQESEDQAEYQAESEIVRHTGLPLPTFPITLHHAIKLAVKGHNVHTNTLINRFIQFRSHCFKIPLVFGRKAWDPHAKEVHEGQEKRFVSNNYLWDFQNGSWAPSFIVDDAASTTAAESIYQNSFDEVLNINFLRIPECLFDAFFPDTKDNEVSIDVDSEGLDWLIEYFFPYYKYVSGIEIIDAKQEKKKNATIRSNNRKAQACSTFDQNREKLQRLAELAVEFSSIQLIPDVQAELEDWAKAFSVFLVNHPNPGIKVGDLRTRKKYGSFLITMSMRRQSPAEDVANELMKESLVQVDAATIRMCRDILWPEEK